jgi:hypothetical protein
VAAVPSGPTAPLTIPIKQKDCLHRNDGTFDAVIFLYAKCYYQVSRFQIQRSVALNMKLIQGYS